MSRSDDIATLRVDIAALKSTVSTLSDALLTAQGALLRLMEAEERRALSLVDTLLDGPEGLHTRTATEAALRRRIRRAALSKHAPKGEA